MRNSFSFIISRNFPLHYISKSVNNFFLHAHFSLCIFLLVIRVHRKLIIAPNSSKNSKYGAAGASDWECFHLQKFHDTKLYFKSKRIRSVRGSRETNPIIVQFFLKVSLLYKRLLHAYLQYCGAGAIKLCSYYSDGSRTGPDVQHKKM
jgi:hypothetical protein